MNTIVRPPPSRTSVMVPWSLAPQSLSCTWTFTIAPGTAAEFDALFREASANREGAGRRYEETG